MNIFKRRRLRWGCLILVVVLCVVAATVLFGDILFNQITGLATRLSIPTTTARYDQLWDDVLLLAPKSSTLLQKNKGELRVADDPYNDCIAGGGSLIYGSNEAFETIISKYASKLNDSGWKHSEVSEWLRADNLDSTSRITLAVPQILSESQRQEWNSYPTLYRVTVIFRAPKVQGCYG